MFVDVCCIYALYIPKINVPVFLKQTQESEPYSAFVVFFFYVFRYVASQFSGFRYATCT